MSLFQYDRIKDWIPYLYQGIYVTILLALVAALLGFIIGIILVVMTKKPLTKIIANAYIDLFRGTPLLLQLSMIYFAIPQILSRVFNDGMGYSINFAIPALVAGFITFSMNSGAYISEIIRSGINSVDKGEIEAAKSLGVSNYHIYKDIILKIAFKNSFPALMNEFITLVKESSIASVIGIADLMRRFTIVSSQTYMYFEPLIIVGIIYYVVIKILTIIGKKVEVKLQYD